VDVVTSGDFDVRSEKVPGGAEAVFVTGDLDLATAPRLDEALAGVTAGVVVVDLSGCTFLDSAGIRALVRAAGSLEQAGRELRLVASDAGVGRLLQITGVDSLVRIHSSLDAAI
jgi:anti-sigma B factor antagonist